MGATTQVPDRYMTAAEVCGLIPGMTPGRLKQMRYMGTGPEYLAPTPRTIVYSERRVREWIEASARMSTREAG
jgi:hypothetical protein